MTAESLTASCPTGPTWGSSQRAFPDAQRKVSDCDLGRTDRNGRVSLGECRPTSTWRWFLTAAKRSGTSGDQQDDPRFGDIRNRYGAAQLVRPCCDVRASEGNGGTDAGDILLNSTVNWQINSNYDLMTVVAHEFGHALGLGESTVSSSVMYGTYNGIKQALTSDDIDGIDSIYGTRQFDQFNTGSQRNNTYTTATNINSYVNNGQIAIPGWTSRPPAIANGFTSTCRPTRLEP